MQQDDNGVDRDKMGRAARIRRRLEETFDPIALEVVDESALHAGHSGAQPGGETHFKVSLTASSFCDVSRVARSRAVNEALKEEFASGLHALSLHLRAPTDRFS